MKNTLTLAVLLIIILPLHAAEVTHIDNAELKSFIGQGIPVIDVRTTSEWKETGVIENSHLIMFYDEKGKYNLEEWLSKVATVVNKDKPVILICHSGSRSKQLATYLTKVAGYEDVYNVKRGIYYWVKQNNLTVAPE